MQTEVNTALGVYSSMFNDPVTVRILFRFATTAPNGTALGANSLAQSNYVFCAVAWNSFLSALIADKKTSNDNTAVANLQDPPWLRTWTRPVPMAAPWD